MIMSSGYVRLKKGAHRDKLEHRVVMADACKEFCVYPLNKDGLPDGFHVEHLDHNRRHNCLSNLILLDPKIHNHISWESWRNNEPPKGQ